MTKKIKKERKETKKLFSINQHIDVSVCQFDILPIRMKEVVCKESENRNKNKKLNDLTCLSIDPDSREFMTITEMCNSAADNKNRNKG